MLPNCYATTREGAMVCTSLGSLLRPLFYFLCYIHFSLSVLPTLHLAKQNQSDNQMEVNKT